MGSIQKIPLKRLLSRERMTPEILKVFNKYDNSIVAHELAHHGKFPPELLTADIAENCDVNGLAVLEYFLDFLAPKLKTDLGYVTDQFAKLLRKESPSSRKSHWKSGTDRTKYRLSNPLPGRGSEMSHSPRNFIPAGGKDDHDGIAENQVQH